jgi:hypothetical protein
MNALMKKFLASAMLASAVAAHAAPVSPTVAPAFTGIDAWLNSACSSCAARLC